MKSKFASCVKIFLLICSLGVYSCTKETFNVEPSAIMQATVNGTLYYSLAQIVFPGPFEGKYYLTDSTSKGFYVNYIFSNDTVGPFPNHYILMQVYIVGQGDTIRYEFDVSSASPIAPGTYTVYGPCDSIPKNATSCAKFYYSGSSYKGSVGITDSTVTGTFTISQISLTNKSAYGSFNVIDTRRNGSLPPKITVSGGQFTNLPMQIF